MWFARPAPLRRAALAALTLVALTSACSGGDAGGSTGPGPGTTDPTGSIVGRYELVTVNGDPLTVPWETDGAFANYFDGGHIELKADGTFTRRIYGRTVVPQMNDIHHDDTWTGTWTFQPSAPGEDNGKVTLHTGADSDEMDITQISITDVNQIPSVNGGTVDMILVYVR